MNAASQKVTRIITPHDKEVAQRLHSIYMRKRKALGLTQVGLTKLTGYQQSTISCHMKGHIALRGARGLLAYANALEVEPSEIDPQFIPRFLRQLNEEIPLPTENLAGKKVRHQARILNNDSPTLRGFLLKQEYLPIYPEGTLIITDADTPILPGKITIMKTEDFTAIALIHKITQRTCTYSMPFGYDACREQNIRTRKLNKEKIERWFPQSKVQIPLSTISYIAPVIAIELP
jgi:transcriptional regulator with XRE-family HTH domain